MLIKLSLNGAENQNNVLEHETQYCPLCAMGKNKTFKTPNKGKVSRHERYDQKFPYLFKNHEIHEKVDGILY